MIASGLGSTQPTGCRCLFPTTCDLIILLFFFSQRLCTARSKLTLTSLGTCIPTELMSSPRVRPLNIPWLRKGFSSPSENTSASTDVSATTCTGDTVDFVGFSNTSINHNNIMKMDKSISKSLVISTKSSRNDKA